MTLAKKLLIIAVYIFAVIGFLLVSVYIAVELGWTKTPGIIDRQHDYFKDQVENDWQSSKEWLSLKEILAKDAKVVQEVSQQTGVPSRMIIAPLVVEQLRLFTSERELFKTVFSPLKVLGNQSQFSWGIMGIKQETAKEIENHLKDATSPWYLGKEYEHILDFSTGQVDSERFYRLTNEFDRKYSYLYAALLIKQLVTQWQKAGYDISDDMGVIATLFNIGFANSKPNPNPQSGGAEIEINKIIYSFGGLAESFYNSEELREVFPVK